MTKIISVIGDQTVAANRLANPENASINIVYHQQQKPIVPAELNLAQQVSNENRRLLASNVGRPGFFNRDVFTSSGTSLIVPESWTLINGEVLHVATGLGTGGSPFSTITVPLSAAPGVGNAWDVVFLEMWYAEVAALGTADIASKNLWANGQVSAATDFASQTEYAIKEPLVTSLTETTRRIQMRWRIRVFNTTTSPVGDGLVASGGYTVAPGGQADSASNNPGLTYSTLVGAINSGLYRAGNGDASSATTFKDVTGYVWAIPICIVAHTAGEGSLVVASQVTDKRRSASPLGFISDDNPNTSILGDDVILRKRDGTETGRQIGSSTPFRFQTGQLVSLVTTGTAPLVVASTTKVTNLNSNYIDVAGTATAAGNSSGNIPVSNGTLNTNLNADMLGGKRVGTAAGNIAALDASGTYAGKINPAQLPASSPLTTVDNLAEYRTSPYVGSGPGGSHPPVDFVLKVDLQNVGLDGTGMNPVGKASFAVSAGNAQTADSAKSVLLANVVGAANSAGILGTPANTPGTLILRDPSGSFSGSNFTGNVSGTATNAVFLSRSQNSNTNPEPLNFPTGYTLHISGPDQWTPQGGVANSWVEPSNKALSIVSFPGLFDFPFKPSRFRVGGTVDIPIRARVFGIIYRQGLGGVADPATYDFRILDPGGTPRYSATMNMSFPGTAPIPAGQKVSFNLQDIGPTTFDLNTTGAWDGMWKIQIKTTDGGPNAYGVGSIYMEVYAYGPNAYGPY